MTRKLTPGDRVRHKATGREYTFHAYPSSQDFPGSRYVRDESGAIREFRADEIEAIGTTPVKITPAQLDEIEATAKKAHDEVGTPWAKSDIFFNNGWGGDVANYLANLDPATTLALVAEVRELRGKVERVRALHEKQCLGDEHRCSGCGYQWPCGTIEALGEEA